jgi:hypothetical protein
MGSHLCVIIFAAKAKKDEWNTGFDSFVEWVEGEEVIEKNMGERKALPPGPECSFDEKTCFCCRSDITTSHVRGN